MKQERRHAPRLRANLKTYLECGADRREAVIRDLSLKGCFVVTPDEFPVGAAVKVEVGLPRVLHMTLAGTVARHLTGRGVGVRFKEVNATQQALLTKLMQNIALRRPE